MPDARVQSLAPAGGAACPGHVVNKRQRLDLKPPLSLISHGNKNFFQVLILFFPKRLDGNHAFGKGPWPEGSML